MHPDDAFNLRKHRWEDVELTPAHGPSQLLRQRVIELHKQGLAYIIDEASGKCTRTPIPPNSVG